MNKIEWIKKILEINIKMLKKCTDIIDIYNYLYFYKIINMLKT
jgi:hypothetical protein